MNGAVNYAIEVENLSKKYPNFHLKDVNFKLPSGMIMGLIGENGAGKTTTLKLLFNQISRESGSIRMLGMDNIERETEIKRQIGVVMDEGFFYEAFKPPQLSKVMKNIYRTWDEELFYRYLEDFNLPKDKSYKDMSTGMSKLLAIATALAHRPRLLVLDEPTSGLDPVVRNKILDILLDFIQDEKHSVLLSSHITSDLEKVADYITFIHKGDVVMSQSKDLILDKYAMMKCGKEDFMKVEENDILGYRKSSFGYEVLVGDRSYMQVRYPGYVFDPVTLEEIMMFYVK